MDSAVVSAAVDPAVMVFADGELSRNTLDPFGPSKCRRRTVSQPFEGVHWLVLELGWHVSQTRVGFVAPEG
jgi:hypothetical protein